MDKDRTQKRLNKMQHHIRVQQVGMALMLMQLITEMMEITPGLAMKSGSRELMIYQIFITLGLIQT